MPLNIILANNYSHAREAARLMKLPREQWRYASDERCVIGIREAKVHLEGEFFKHPKFLEIYERLQINGLVK